MKQNHYRSSKGRDLYYAGRFQDVNKPTDSPQPSQLHGFATGFRSFAELGSGHGGEMPATGPAAHKKTQFRAPT